MSASTSCTRTHQTMCSKMTSLYDFRHQKRGYAIIINNVDFGHDKKRQGADRDMHGLRPAFLTLGFDKDDIFTERNLTTQGMKDYLRQRVGEDHTNHDCFVFVILTHGDFLPTTTDKVRAEMMTDMVCGTDGIVALKELMEIVEQCEGLKGKPKIFIVQACRSKEMRASDPVTVEHLESAPRRPGSSLTGTQATSVDAQMLLPRTEEIRLPYEIPVSQDCLLVYASQPGYVAFRDPDMGAVFIQRFCKQVKANGTTLDLLSLLTRVSRDVAYDYESVIPGGELDRKKMMPWVASRLTKDVVFSEKVATEVQETVPTQETEQDTVSP